MSSSEHRVITAKWFRAAILLVLLTPATACSQSFDEAPEQLRVMTWNVEWMFDDYLGDNRSRVAKEQSSPSKAYWDHKLAGVAKVIAEANPQIVALQEIEGRQTLSEIARQIKDQYGIAYRYAFIEGTDSFLEQDVGLLMQGGLISYRRQEQSRAMYESEQYYNISKHIIAEFRWQNVARPLTLMNVHFRAREEAEEFRVRQAKLARLWLEDPLAEGHDVILLGDLNSEHPAGVRKGDIAEIVGSEPRPPMFDLLTQLSDPRTPTHLILEKQFDRILVSQSLLENEVGEDWVFERIEVLDQAVIRGERDGQEHWDERLDMDLQELDLSDHHPVIATFLLQ